MEQLDPEMIKNLDLLLDMDVSEQESDWEVIENLDEAEASLPEEK